MLLDLDDLILDSDVEMLLRCGRYITTGILDEKIISLAHSVRHWDALLHLASWHGAIPLVDHALSQHAGGIIPEEIAKTLVVQSGWLQRRGAVLAEDLVDIYQLLSLHGIVALPFKGAVIGKIAYSQPGLRPFADLDFIVRHKEYHRAQQILRANGMKPGKQMPSEQHFYLRRDGRHISVDLHKNFSLLVLPGPKNPDLFFQHLSPVTLAGTQINSFSTEIMLYMSCMQLVQDWLFGGSYFIRLCDIGGLLRVIGPENVEQVVANARDYGLGNIVAIVVAATARFFSLDILARISPSLSAAQIDALSDQIIHPDRVFSTHHKKRGFFGFGRTLLSLYDTRVEAFSRYLPFILARLVSVTDQDRSWIRLPSYIDYLYVVLRPIRLMAKYGGELLFRKQ